MLDKRRRKGIRLESIGGIFVVCGLQFSFLHKIVIHLWKHDLYKELDWIAKVHNCSVSPNMYSFLQYTLKHFCKDNFK